MSKWNVWYVFFVVFIFCFLYSCILTSDGILQMVNERHWIERETVDERTTASFFGAYEIHIYFGEICLFLFRWSNAWVLIGWLHWIRWKISLAHFFGYYHLLQWTHTRSPGSIQAAFTHTHVHTYMCNDMFIIITMIVCSCSSCRWFFQQKPRDNHCNRR